MTADGPPTLADQVSRLYDLVAGYHATHLVEIARELGVWEAVTGAPGVTSDELAARPGTDPFYTDVLCRTAFSFGLLEREGPGWRMAPHFDQILGDPASSFYLARAPRVHMLLGEDYSEYVGRFRAGTARSYQEHGEAFMREAHEGLKTLPADLPRPGAAAPARAAGPASRAAPGCWTWAAAAAGGSSRSPSGSPGRPASGSTWSPTRSSWRGG